MMQPTLSLNDAAGKFWDRHAERLEEDGLLTDSDLDSFTLLCQTWGLLVELDAKPGARNYREMTQRKDLWKQYQEGAKQFGLFPRERKVTGLGPEESMDDIKRRAFE